MAENNTGYELGWESSIENDGPDFVLLPSGDYDFTVTGFERGRYGGGGKLPPCNKAILTIAIEGDQGTTYIKHNLFLHSSLEGLLCEFFTSIGQRKHGERMTMNWGAVQGAKGRCKVGVRTYKNNDGEEITINDIKKFYEPDPNAVQPAGIPTGQATYQAGKF